MRTMSNFYYACFPLFLWSCAIQDSGGLSQGQGAKLVWKVSAVPKLSTVLNFVCFNYIWNFPAIIISVGFLCIDILWGLGQTN